LVELQFFQKNYQKNKSIRPRLTTRVAYLLFVRILSNQRVRGLAGRTIGIISLFSLGGKKRKNSNLI